MWGLSVCLCFCLPWTPALLAQSLCQGQSAFCWIWNVLPKPQIHLPLPLLHAAAEYPSRSKRQGLGDKERVIPGISDPVSLNAALLNCTGFFFLLFSPLHCSRANKGRNQWSLTEIFTLSGFDLVKSWCWVHLCAGEAHGKPGTERFLAKEGLNWSCAAGVGSATTLGSSLPHSGSPGLWILSLE